MRSSNTATLSDSNDFLCSYLVELRNIAINSRSLSYSTSLRLKKAAILIGSRRVRKQKSEKVADLLDVDEEDWDVEYDLLAPSNVAIADDTIALQQFGEVIFCAPQEDILEGEHVSAFSGATSQLRNYRFLSISWLQASQRPCSRGPPNHERAPCEQDSTRGPVPDP